MEKIPATLEKYDGSFRITPERPTTKGKNLTSTFSKVRAELFHWEDSDAMDIFLIPPRNPAAATSRVVKAFDWGSVTRSIYGCYRMSLAALDREGKPYTIKEISAHAAEAQRWIAEDAKTFQPQVKTKKKTL